MKFLPLLLLLTACTYSVAMVHSVGSTDDIEESQTASPDISPTLSIPMASAPKGMNGPNRVY
jgi:hypothetical protein